MFLPPTGVLGEASSGHDLEEGRDHKSGTTNDPTRMVSLNGTNVPSLTSFAYNVCGNIW